MKRSRQIVDNLIPSQVQLVNFNYSLCKMYMCNSIEFEISNMKMLCAFIIIDLLIHEMLSRKKSFPIPMSALLVFLVQFIFAASPAITSSKMLTIMHPTKFYFPVYYLAIFVPSQVNTSGCPFLTNVRLTLSEFHPYFQVT